VDGGVTYTPRGSIQYSRTASESGEAHSVAAVRRSAKVVQPQSSLVGTSVFHFSLLSSLFYRHNSDRCRNWVPMDDTTFEFVMAAALSPFQWYASSCGGQLPGVEASWSSC
jgi:hypothetical protein